MPIRARAVLFLALASLSSLPSWGSGAQTDCADVALVFAIDSSGSIDDREFALQTRGHAAALLDPAVVRAVAAAGVVDLAVVVWGDKAYGVETLPWARVQKAQDLAPFAAELQARQRRIRGETSLGNGLSAALALLADPTRCAARRLVDVSGDGRASSGPARSGDVAVASARRLAERSGVTVNALAVRGSDPGLANYFRREVATGSDAFVLEVASFAGFADAIRQKLERELTPPLVAMNNARTPLR